MNNLAKIGIGSVLIYGVYKIFTTKNQTPKGLNAPRADVKTKLQRIAQKYREIEFNKDNYDIGGGLDDSKFASNRHEDALNDPGKLTFGKATQLFKKATGLDVDFVKELIRDQVPIMEWHHAGKLPKRYGGGMKKTYFLNAKEIVDLADNWAKYENILKKKRNQESEQQKIAKNRSEIRDKFLKKYATYISREPSFKIKLKYFYETDREMKGKYGWFSSYGKDYNLVEYLSGWQFRSQKKYNEFLSL